MTDWASKVAGDVIEVHTGRHGTLTKIKLSRSPEPAPHLSEDAWYAPGYRWISTKKEFSGSGQLHVFHVDQAPDATEAAADPAEGAEAPEAPVIAATLTVYRFQGEHAAPVKSLKLSADKATLLDILAMVRAGLPEGEAASLTDEGGCKNI